MYSYYIYICLSKHEKRLSSNDTTLLLLFKIEPFDFKEAVKFQMPYLAGYLADKYDVS